MKKNIKQIEELIETKLKNFSYPDGVRRLCNNREIEVISVMGSKLKSDLKILNKKSDLTFAQIEKYYHALMDSFFGEKMLEKVEVSYRLASGYEKEQIENFIDTTKASIEYGKTAIAEYQKNLKVAKQGKKVIVNRL